MTDRLGRTAGEWPMPERSALASVLGVPVWIAVLLAALLTAIGVTVDLMRGGNLAAVFTVCHVVGCLLAIVWVRRDGVFWPMVQPPLLVAITVPALVLLAGGRAGSGFAERALMIVAPLVNAFPIMAITAGGVVAIGAIRLLLQPLHTRTGRATDADAGSEDDGSATTGPPSSRRR